MKTKITELIEIKKSIDELNEIIDYNRFLLNNTSELLDQLESKSKKIMAELKGDN